MCTQMCKLLRHENRAQYLYRSIHSLGVLLTFLVFSSVNLFQLRSAYRSIFAKYFNSQNYPFWV